MVIKVCENRYGSATIDKVKMDPRNTDTDPDSLKNLKPYCLLKKISNNDREATFIFNIIMELELLESNLVRTVSPVYMKKLLFYKYMEEMDFAHSPRHSKLNKMICLVISQSQKINTMVQCYVRRINMGLILF
ncbi:uncharacterized protein [Rutidosis leptorrhynchoides]|uniref:uncharacterized protein n=1 Tax=Rutidosis leptorrhynchoides TaxID=125765 RepID=UPI003A98FBB4